MPIQAVTIPRPPISRVSSTDWFFMLVCIKTLSHSIGKGARQSSTARKIIHTTEAKQVKPAIKRLGFLSQKSAQVREAAV